VFYDVGQPFEGGFSWRNAMADAGVGLALRGKLYDRDYRIRFDLPLYVKQVYRPLGPANQEIALRLVVSSREVF
jgi:hypothetical protein